MNYKDFIIFPLVLFLCSCLDGDFEEPDIKVQDIDLLSLSENEKAHLQLNVSIKNNDQKDVTIEGGFVRILVEDKEFDAINIKDEFNISANSSHDLVIDFYIDVNDLYDHSGDGSIECIFKGSLMGETVVGEKEFDFHHVGACPEAKKTAGLGLYDPSALKKEKKNSRKTDNQTSQDNSSEYKDEDDPESEKIKFSDPVIDFLEPQIVSEEEGYFFVQQYIVNNSSDFDFEIERIILDVRLHEQNLDKTADEELIYIGPNDGNTRSLRIAIDADLLEILKATELIEATTTLKLELKVLEENKDFTYSAKNQLYPYQFE